VAEYGRHITISTRAWSSALLLVGIVEFGCGNGRDSLYLAKQGYSVIAGDLSTEAIHNNSQKAAALTSQQSTTCNNKIQISFDECTYCF